MLGLHNFRMNGHRLESRRRTPHGVVVLAVAIAMCLVSIGFTIVVAFTLERRVAAIESVLGIRQ